MKLAGTLLIVLAATSIPIDAPKDFPFLASLTVPKDRLPEGCQPAEIPANFLGLKEFKNLAVTTDQRLFVIGDERLSKLLDPTKIQATYFGLYNERNDLGIIAWAFRSEGAAKEAHAKLTESYKREPERMRFWRAGRHVVWLWRDPGTSDACFAALAKFLQGRVDRVGR